MMPNNRIKNLFEDNSATYNNIAQIFKYRAEQSHISPEDDDQYMDATSFEGVFPVPDSMQRYNDRTSDNFQSLHANQAIKSPQAQRSSLTISSHHLVEHQSGSEKIQLRDDARSPQSQQHIQEKELLGFELELNDSSKSPTAIRMSHRIKLRKSSIDISQSSQAGPRSTINNIMRFCTSNEDAIGLGKKNELSSENQSNSSVSDARNHINGMSAQKNNTRALNSHDLQKTRLSRIIQSAISASALSGIPQEVKNANGNKQELNLDKSGVSKTTTQTRSKATKTKKKPFNFLALIMRMKNYVYRIASKVESKRIAILSRQNFEFLRDKSSAVFSLERQYSAVNEYNSIQNAAYKIETRLGQLKCVRGIQSIFPSIPLFQPQSSWKFIWDILHAIIIISFFFFLPLNMIYGVNVEQIFQFKSFDFIICIVATLDILFSLNTAIFWKGNLLQHRAQICIEYFSKDGLVSVLSAVIMWTMILEVFKNENEQINVTLGSIFMCILVWKILSLKSIQDQINDRFYFNKMQRGIIQLTSILFNLFIFSHLFACSWLLLGKSAQIQQSTTSSHLNDCPPIQQTSTGECMRSWLDKLRSSHSSLSFYEEYLRAYYFMTVTMVTVGYGDITPMNSNEYLLSILTMIIACGMFGYGLNSIGRILAEMYADYKAYDEHFNAINGFMHQKAIPLDLQFQVREYLQYFFLKSNVEDLQVQQRVIQILPEYLSTSLMFQANKIVLAISPIFKNNFSDQIVAKTIAIIEQKKYRPGEQIIEQNSPDDQSICFIEKGTVEVYNKCSNETMQVLGHGKCFGEVAFFSGMQRNLSVKATDFTTLLIIKRLKFLNLIRNSPIDYERFSMIKDQINLNSRFEGINISCLCCKSTSHLITECDFVHLSSDRSKVIIESCREQFQKREDLKRREGQFNALDNLDAIQEIAEQFMEDNTDSIQNEPWFNDILNKEMMNMVVRRNNTSFPQRSLNNIQRDTVIGDPQNSLSIYNGNTTAGVAEQRRMATAATILKTQQQQNLEQDQNSHAVFFNDLQQGKAYFKDQFNYHRVHSVRSEDGQNHSLNHSSNFIFPYSQKKVQFSAQSMPQIEQEEDTDGFKGLISNGYQQNIQFSQNVEKPSSIVGVVANSHCSSSVSIQHPSKIGYSSQGSNQNPTGADVSNSQIGVVQHHHHQPAQAFQLKGFLKQYTALSQAEKEHSNFWEESEQGGGVQSTILIPASRATKRKITVKTDFGRCPRQKTTSHTVNAAVAAGQGGGSNRMPMLNSYNQGFSSVGIISEKPHEQLFRQLYELIQQQPQLNRYTDLEEPFETQKEFTAYMPQNNMTKVLNSCEYFRRKRVGILWSRRSDHPSTMKSTAKAISTRNAGGTGASSRYGLYQSSTHKTKEASLPQIEQSHRCNDELEEK